MQARYCSATQGRFTSTDPENAGASLENPQTLNAYSYALNNPGRFIDPDGLRWAQIDLGDGAISYTWFDDEIKDDNGLTAYDRALANGYTAVTFDEAKPYRFTNGFIAPGETLTTFTLTTDGQIIPSSHIITDVEFARYVYAMYVAGGDMERVTLEFLVSVIGSPGDISTPSTPSIPGPTLAPWRSITPSRPLDKMGHASKHLKDFQKIDPSLTADDVAKILEHVRATGTSTATRFGGKAFQGVVQIGGKSVTVKVIESAGEVINTGYPLR